MMEQIKRLFWLWGQCFKSMKKFNTFSPFIIYAILQVFVLYALVNFVQTPFSNVLIPVIKKFFSSAALHYPNYFYVVTPLFNQFNIILSGLFGIAIIAIATNLFADNFKSEKIKFGNALKVSLPKYGVLFIIWIIETVLTLAMIVGLPQLLIKILQPTYRIGRIFELGGLVLGVLIASIFAYTTALIILDNQKIFQSISKTFQIFKDNVVISFFLVAVPTFVYFPISFVARKSQFIITKFSPEMIVALLGFGIFVTLVTSYFQIGSITRFYLYVTGEKK